jgi:hypothetical protein
MTTIASIIFYAIAIFTSAIFGYSAGEKEPHAGVFFAAVIMFALGVFWQVFG